MSYEITKPQNGRVTLDLNWRDAEILCRLIGMANSGNLKSVSPPLSEFVEDMVEIVGRNSPSEAHTYIANVGSFGQVYISTDVK